MKGGVLLVENILTVFKTTPGYLDSDERHTLMRNAFLLWHLLGECRPTITLISNTSRYGYIFKVEPTNGKFLAEEYKTTCGKNIKNPNCYEPIRSYIIKITFIGTHDTPIYQHSEKDYMGREEFGTECSNQSILYKRRFLNGQYYVPPTITTGAIFLNEVEPLHQGYKKVVIDQFSKIDSTFRKDLARSATPDVGLFIMGCAEGFDVKDKPTPHDLLLCKFVHILLCRFEFVYHGDPHLGNVLVHSTYESPHEWYDGNRTGRAILIDFGRIRPCSKESIPTIKGLWWEGRFTDLLTYIFAFGISKKYHNHPLYQWLRTHTPGDNEKLQQMVQNYMTYHTDKRHMNNSVEIMEKKRYNFMNQGGKRKTRRKRRTTKRRESTSTVTIRKGEVSKRRSRGKR